MNLPIKDGHSMVKYHKNIDQVISESIQGDL